VGVLEVLIDRDGDPPYRTPMIFLVFETNSTRSAVSACQARNGQMRSSSLQAQPKPPCELGWSSAACCVGFCRRSLSAVEYSVGRSRRRCRWLPGKVDSGSTSGVSKLIIGCAGTFSASRRLFILFSSACAKRMPSKDGRQVDTWICFSLVYDHLLSGSVICMSLCPSCSRVLRGAFIL